MRYTEDCVPALPTGAWGARFVTEQGERNHQAVRCAGGIRSAAFARRNRSIDVAPYRSAAPMSYGAGEASGLPFSNT
jgi:hypothetical protein